MADPAPVIAEVEVVTDEVVAALRRLVPQLNASVPLPTHAALSALVASPHTSLFVARHDGQIAGTLTLLLVPIPTGVRAQIEDVVVDAACRGHGLGTALMQAALQRARTTGAPTVDLTSHPTRIAANRLYKRLGFKRRRTNVYRFRG